MLIHPLVCLLVIHSHISVAAGCATLVCPVPFFWDMQKLWLREGLDGPRAWPAITLRPVEGRFWVALLPTNQGPISIIPYDSSSGSKPIQTLGHGSSWFMNSGLRASASKVGIQTSFCNKDPALTSHNTFFGETIKAWQGPTLETWRGFCFLHSNTQT